MLKIKDNTVIKKMMSMPVTILVTGVLLFAGFAKPASAWPPPCPDPNCQYWDGNECVPIDVNSVTSDANVAPICTYFNFTAITDPAGHGDKVKWSAPGGDSNTGGGATFSTRWPCINGKTVTASLCASSANKNVTVTLPTGCGNAGAHDSNVTWTNPNDDFYSSTCTIFGVFSRPYATYDVDYKYSSCTWVCEITNLEAETRIRVRDPNSLFPGKVSVSQASDVPCADANLAKVDLNDPNTNDDVGAPRTKYWCYNGTVAHEQKHRTDWRAFYGDELAEAVTDCESLDVTIDCDDPNTITCGSAKSSKIAEINERFNQAYQDAYDRYNLPGTPLKEHEQRAYLENYSYEQPISAALPGGCTP